MPLDEHDVSVIFLLLFDYVIIPFWLWMGTHNIFVSLIPPIALTSMFLVDFLMERKEMFSWVYHGKNRRQCYYRPNCLVCYVKLVLKLVSRRR
ncbi:hypothetical protein DRO45_00030 [Candidatus Bathyarchaeota archaeon]|nr:MAG: hypothetical protein DRO45_00030 [Candidatus Bathyarchaeota archaeon]